MAHPPDVIYTQRMVLRLNDPDDAEDCEKLIRAHNYEGSSAFGIGRIGIRTVEDLQTKHREHGPRKELCTKSAPPRGLYHLIFLKDDHGKAGEFMGWISMSFRNTMPCPDIGYNLFPQFCGTGYGTEAARAALRWWREEVGVKEVWAGALPTNQRSQRTAVSVGFVRGGEADYCFGSIEDESWTTGPVFILPGMDWSRFEKNGQKPIAQITTGLQTAHEERKASGVE